MARRPAGNAGQLARRQHPVCGSSWTSRAYLGPWCSSTPPRRCAARTANRRAEVPGPTLRFPVDNGGTAVPRTSGRRQPGATRKSVVQLYGDGDAAPIVTARNRVTAAVHAVELQRDRTAVEEVPPPVIGVGRLDADRHRIPVALVRHRSTERPAGTAAGLGWRSRLVALHAASRPKTRSTPSLSQPASSSGRCRPPRGSELEFLLRRRTRGSP